MAEQRLTPKEIYEGCCRNDEGAWGIVFQVCVQMGERAGLGDAARDLAQDTVLDLIKGKIDRVENPDGFIAFVRQMMRFAIINRLRNPREKNDPEPVIDDTAPDPEPEDRLYSRRMRQFVWDILADLEPRCRKVLRLSTTGYKHREIADLLGVPINTVSTWVRRCIRRFQEHPRFATVKEEWR
jgi:RNA polymerase sigma factor (sigma-70 family)